MTQLIFGKAFREGGDLAGLASALRTYSTERNSSVATSNITDVFHRLDMLVLQMYRPLLGEMFRCFNFSHVYSLIGLKTLWNYDGLFQLQYHPGLLQHTFKRSPAHRILSIMLWLFLFGWVTLLAVPLNLRNAWFLPCFPHLTPQEFIGYHLFKLNVRRCRRKLLLWLKTRWSLEQLSTIWNPFQFVRGLTAPTVVLDYLRALCQPIWGHPTRQLPHFASEMMENEKPPTLECFMMAQAWLT